MNEIDVTVKRTATPAAKKPIAFDMYMKGHTHKEIIEQAEVSDFLLKKWIREEKWKDQRNELVEQTQQNFIQKHHRFIMDQRIETMGRHVRISKKLEERIELMVEKKLANGEIGHLTDEEVLNIAKALKSATDVSARAVGLSDKIDPISNQVATNNGTIVNIGMKALPIESEDIPIADVEVVEKKPCPF